MNREAFFGLLQLMNNSDTICIIGHSSPDGDCITSAFALREFCIGLGKQTDIALAGKIPYNYDHFIDTSVILTEDFQKNYDLAIAVDCANTMRLGIFAGLFYSAGLNVVIDHHSTNTGFATINIIDTSVSSTCEMIYHFFKSIGYEISQQIAEYLYIGMLTDTGKFRYPSTNGNTHRVIADLIDYGARPYEIYRCVFKDKPLGIVRACSASMNSISTYAGGKIVIAKITKEIASHNEGNIDEIDGIIDWLMEIRGVKIACVLKEVDKYVKVSLRSVATVDLKNLAMNYHGGGHAHAAGFSLPGTIKNAEYKLKKELAGLIEVQMSRGEIL